MKKNLFVLFLLLSLCISSFAQTATKKNSPAMKASVEISAKQLSDYLHFVASDEMEGRDTPSRGLDTTAKFIGMNLSRWGFKPAGDNGTFYQKIALRRNVADMTETKLEVGGQKFAFGDEFLRLAGEGTVANAGLVYGKDGWFVQAKNIDPYQGVDVKGKIVVLYTEGFPDQRSITNSPVPRNELKPAERGTTWADPMTYAKQKGAAGIILVASPTLQENWDQAKSFLSGGGMYPEKLRDAPAEKRMPVIIVSRKVGDSIFPSGQNPTKTGETLSSANLETQANMGIITKPEIVYTQNVVAIWEGSDPILRKEMVAIGAHYDHIGMSPNSSNPDKISNGADDDGSGTVAVLSIAEALAKSKMRPKRSVLLVWHCGEEKGLWGSEYFNKFPTVDIKQVTAQLNIDMIGRSKKAGNTEPKDKELSDENTIYVIGSNMMSSKLGEVVANTNKSYMNMNYDFRYDDPKDPNRFFFRSDHFNYAVNGIPISFWFDGVHVDYHGVGDEPEKIDYVRMEKITRTIFLTLWELGNLKERPKIDKELPKELTQR
jgi:hypothetical protein